LGGEKRGEARPRLLGFIGRVRGAKGTSIFTLSLTSGGEKVTGRATAVFLSKKRGKKKEKKI